MLPLRLSSSLRGQAASSDVGIDVQVEILNEDKESTGRFVALQVKATAGQAGSYWTVGAVHLNYWREMEVPVFVVLVVLLESYVARLRYTRKAEVKGNLTVTNQLRAFFAQPPDFDALEEVYVIGKAVGHNHI